MKRKGQNWYSKIPFKEAEIQTECEILEPSLGLSFLKNYSDVEEDEEEFVERTPPITDRISEQLLEKSEPKKAVDDEKSVEKEPEKVEQPKEEMKQKQEKIKHRNYRNRKTQREETEKIENDNRKNSRERKCEEKEKKRRSKTRSKSRDKTSKREERRDKESQTKSRKERERKTREKSCERSKSQSEKSRNSSRKTDKTSNKIEDKSTEANKNEKPPEKTKRSASSPIEQEHKTEKHQKVTEIEENETKSQQNKNNDSEENSFIKSDIDLQTPDTDEYHSLWESDEDEVLGIPAKKLPSSPKRVPRKSWESDEEVFERQKYVRSSKSPSRFGDRRSSIDKRSQRSMELEKKSSAERCLEMPLNICSFRRNSRGSPEVNYSRYSEYSMYEEEKKLDPVFSLFTEDSWEKDVKDEVRLLEEERKSLSEERKLLEIERKKLEELERKQQLKDHFFIDERSSEEFVRTKSRPFDHHEFNLENTEYDRSYNRSIDYKQNFTITFHNKAKDNLEFKSKHQEDKSSSRRHEPTERKDRRYSSEDKESSRRKEKRKSESSSLERDVAKPKQEKHRNEKSKKPVEDKSKRKEEVKETVKDAEAAAIPTSKKLENEYEEFIKAVNSEVAIITEEKEKKKLPSKHQEESKGKKTRKVSSTSSSSSSSDSSSSSTSSSSSDSSSEESDENEKRDRKKTAVNKKKAVNKEELLPEKIKVAVPKVEPPEEKKDVSYDLLDIALPELPKPSLNEIPLPVPSPDVKQITPFNLEVPPLEVKVNFPEKIIPNIPDTTSLPVKSYEDLTEPIVDMELGTPESDEPKTPFIFSSITLATKKPLLSKPAVNFNEDSNSADFTDKITRKIDFLEEEEVKVDVAKEVKVPEVVREAPIVLEKPAEEKKEIAPRCRSRSPAAKKDNETKSKFPERKDDNDRGRTRNHDETPSKRRDPSPQRNRRLSPPRRREISPRRHRNVSPRRDRNRPLSPRRYRNSRYSSKRREISPRRGDLNSKRDVSPRRTESRRDLSPKRRDVSPRYRGASPKREASSRHRRLSPLRRRDPSPRKRNRSPVTESDIISLKRSRRSRSGSPIRDKSPVNSPLDGFKCSVADSTISDDLLPQYGYGREPSPVYAAHAFNSTNALPDSPKRIPLDDRLSQVFGLEKETPKPISTTYSDNYTCKREYYEQPRQYPQYGIDVQQYGELYGQSSVVGGATKVVQVGNMIQIVPTEETVVVSQL